MIYIMEIIGKYNPLTGMYGKYNINTCEWEENFSGGSLIDVFTKVASNIASKVTSDTAKKLAETTAKTALESASKKAGDELGKYAVEKIKDKVSRPKLDLVVKELHKPNDGESIRTPSPPSKLLYRGGKGIKKLFKKYNI